jgi:hypothetical protein
MGWMELDRYLSERNWDDFTASQVPGLKQHVQIIEDRNQDRTDDSLESDMYSFDWTESGSQSESASDSLSTEHDAGLVAPLTSCASELWE